MKSPYLIDILFPVNDKPTRGGKRKGAGRPAKKQTVVKTYRCYPEEVEQIKAAIAKVREQSHYTVGVTSTGF